MVGRIAILKAARVSDSIGAGSYGKRTRRLDDGNDRLVTVGLPATAPDDPKNCRISGDETRQDTEQFSRQLHSLIIARLQNCFLLASPRGQRVIAIVVARHTKAFDPPARAEDT